VTGRAAIRYHNRSPNALPVVALQLAQNIHAPGAVRLDPQEVTGGVEITRVAVAGQTLRPGALDQGPTYEVFGTTMAVRLPAPLQPGRVLTLDVEWSFQVPQSGAGRMGWSRDDLFHIAYWYPLMAVYDDLEGWNTDAYTGNAEFYAGFGSYELTVEAPAGWIVRATGRLQNPAEVLPEPIRDRLDRADRSDTVVRIVTAEDLAAGPGNDAGDGGPPAVALRRGHGAGRGVQRDARLPVGCRPDTGRRPGP
jgi:hypothetical protein